MGVCVESLIHGPKVINHMWQLHENLIVTFVRFIEKENYNNIIDTTEEKIICLTVKQPVGRETSVLTIILLITVLIW